jgi:hypothetical protein
MTVRYIPKIILLVLFSAQTFAVDVCKKSIQLDVKTAKDVLPVGAKIKTPLGLNLSIAKVILDGHKGIVYKALDKNGKAWALKVPRFDLPEYNYDVKASLVKEVAKIPAYEKLNIPYARIIEAGPDYLVKEWVEGVRGDEWVNSWSKLSSSKRKSDPRYQQLMQLFENISAQGAYVGNLKSINMIHDGQTWIIVDSSTPKIEAGRPDEMRAKYNDVFEKRWIRGLQ